jgi:protein TonB
MAAASCVLRGQETIRVAEADAKKAATNMVKPEYPALARQMGVSGLAVVQAEVGTDGNVEKVSPVKGNVLLSSAAARAVQQWKFTPFTSEGKPVKAVMVLTFNFVQ